MFSGSFGDVGVDDGEVGEEAEDGVLLDAWRVCEEELGGEDVGWLGGADGGVLLGVGDLDVVQVAEDIREEVFVYAGPELGEEVVGVEGDGGGDEGAGGGVGVDGVADFGGVVFVFPLAIDGWWEV